MSRCEICGDEVFSGHVCDDCKEMAKRGREYDRLIAKLDGWVRHFSSCPHPVSGIVEGYLQERLTDETQKTA